MTQNKKECHNSFACIFSKKERRKMSITAKIMYYFIIFMSVILVLLWLCQVIFFERIYKTMMISELKNQAQTLISLEDDPAFSVNAQSICEDNNSCVTVYSNTTKSAHNISDIHYKDCYLYELKINQIINLYEKAQNNSGELLYAFTFDPVERGYYGAPFSVDSTDESHSVLYIKLFTDNSGEECAIFVNRVISPVGTTSRTILHILVLVSALYIIMAVILVIIISRNIAKPLIGVNQSAKELEKGNYNAKYLQKTGYREVDELAHTLENASSELSKVEKLQKELIANVSHDLRTPLTLIAGYSEMMRDIPGEATKENCQTIIDEVARLSSLVNDLLEISKLQSGSLEPNITEFSLTSMLQSCIGTYSELTSAQGYNMSFDYDREITVSADMTMILQAVRNLINNALTFTGSDLSVKISQTVQDGFVKISVTDTGEGISPCKLRNIWERYYRDTEHKRAANGTGLGLSIVKSVVKIHNGRYGVKSKIGCGSTFWVELPIKEDAQNA
ncbi:MAG: HAMP domain-containing histidine kinase [Ruminococcaceae bacterium]|nr:HAMP domain-containing histidine kinase [Oscillospiraceae bacterium]